MDNTQDPACSTNSSVIEPSDVISSRQSDHYIIIAYVKLNMQTQNFERNSKLYCKTIILNLKWHQVSSNTS